MENVVNVIKPSVIVLFGITGDLARHKIVPALYHLYRDGQVHRQTYVVGISRQAIEPTLIIDQLRGQLQANSETIHDDALQHMADQLSMVQLDPAADSDYDVLTTHLQQLDEQVGSQLDRLYYLSLPPQAYEPIITKLGQHGLNNGRILIEKPFGYDVASAQHLISKTAEHFDERQVYRIDHYLAKETAQNILAFRSSNPLFADIWDGQHITKVSITAAESIGIEGRANFYDQIGALRDVIQSHLLQLLSITLMDVPTALNAASVHAGKQAVLDSLELASADTAPVSAIRGQYDGYRDEVEVSDSVTETYAAVRLRSTDSRWQGTELLVTNGKGLQTKRTSITVDFGHGSVNRLQFRIQPNEGITLALQVKDPGLEADTRATSMEFDYQTAFDLPTTLDAYERVLIDAMRGDRTLFATDEEVLRSWRILQPVLDAWQGNDSGLQRYAIGSDGPDVA